MKRVNVVLGICLLTMTQAVLILPSHAFDLVGAWSSDARICSKIFSRTANAISFRQDSDQYGKGFIVEGNVIRGPTAKCVIKSKKENGSETNLLASCASEIMVDQTQLIFRIVDDNTIVRKFPGMENLESSYVRCPL